MILLIYNQNSCKEFLLPNLHNADYTIPLHKEAFLLRSDVILKLEITKEGWRICESGEYALETSENQKERCILNGGEILRLRTENGETLHIITVSEALSFHVMQKYDLSFMQEISIGRSDANVIVYRFLELVSAQHAVCRREADGWYLYDTSTNGVFTKQGRVSGNLRLEFGEVVHIFGLHLVFLGNMLAVGAYYGELEAKEDILKRYVPQKEKAEDVPHKKRGKPVYFNRSPRNLPHIYTDPVEIEAPPQPKAAKTKPMLLTIGPSFTMAIPMLLGCGLAVFSAKSTGRSSGLYMYTGMVTAISSAIIGVIWAFANLKYSGREAEEEELHRFNAFSNYLIQIADSIKEKYRNNTEALLKMYPSAEVCSRYDAQNPNLWNRNFTHEDFLYIRLGLGELPFQTPIQIPKDKFTLVDDSLIEKPRMIYDEYKMLHDVPVGISLMENQLVGLVGGKEKSGAMRLMFAMAAQIAASHCYTDVKMVFVYRETDKQRQEAWNGLRWFPHVWSEDKRTRYIASDEIEMRDVFFELGNVMRVRSQNQTQESKRKIVKPHYVIFVSDPSLLEGEMLAKYILEPKPEYGITTILMAETADRLPNTCEEIIENDGYFTGMYNLMNVSEEKQYITFDSVFAAQLEQMGRTLSDIRVNETETTGEIPAELDFFQMYGVNSLEEFQVLDRWRKNRTYNSMRALIGKKAGNADCYLDIHEKYHGPHGLIAGTTGSGKSETLQTYILSVALNFSPDDVGFFVIDFKGGGMANLFSDLPHMIGQISNLSGNQVHRAMISIKSENMRRQRIFNEHGVNNINLYTRLYKNHEAKQPVPHLFIIIDEFAELKREEPDFMKELISVAQVGRSLGVHLILATQKPGGTVDDNIRSNSKFRLCLRVQDRQDSQEMLGKPDAAYITQAGRGYLQVGNDELYELFQSGYSGAAYDESGAVGSGVYLISNTGKASIISSRKNRKKAADAVQNGTAVKECTQLDAVVAYLKKLAEENGYNKNLQLWLPVLPRQLYFEELEEYRCVFDESGWHGKEKKWTLRAPVGLYDDPENQAQHALWVSFSDNGHHAVLGTVVSGKSTFLQSLLYALMMRYSPAQLNIYALDFSSRMLSAFEEAPHVGGVVYDNEEDRVSKFFHMLQGMMEERKKQFRGGNYSQYVQAYGQNLPAVLVIIDNMAAFREKTAGKYDDALIRLCREGVGYGIYLIVTAAGFGLNEIPNRMGDHIRTVISLEQGDKMKYMDALRMTHISVMPEADVKGRGVAFVDGRLLEFQTALSAEAEDDFERIRKLQRLSKQMADVWTGKRARMIPEIPAEPTLSQLAACDGYAQAVRSGDYLPVAYCIEDASVYSVSLSSLYCYTILGKARSGKTNVLKLLMYAASQTDGESAVFGGEAGELARYADDCSARYLRNKEEMYDYFLKLQQTFIARNKKKRDFLAAGMDEAELYIRMKTEKPIFLFIEDMAEFFKLIYRKDVSVPNINGFLENILEKGSLHRIYFFGCLSPEEMPVLMGYKAFASYVGYKKGMLLGGNVSSQRMFQFQNIPYTEAGKAMKKGLALVPDEEDETIARKAVVPFVKKEKV